MTTDEKREADRLLKDYQDRVDAKYKARKEQMATKYSDEVIREHIDKAVKVGSMEYAKMEAEIAQAMIAYNQMIEARWNNA